MSEEDLVIITEKINHLLSILSKKWVIEIIVNLLDRHLRFKKLQSAIPQISAKELSEKLKFLFQNGIIEKIVLNAIPTVIVYQLTDKGDLLRKNLLQLYLTGLAIDMLEGKMIETEFQYLKERWQSYLE